MNKKKVEELFNNFWKETDRKCNHYYKQVHTKEEEDHFNKANNYYLVSISKLKKQILKCIENKEKH